MICFILSMGLRFYLDSFVQLGLHVIEFLNCVLLDSKLLVRLEGHLYHPSVLFTSFLLIDWRKRPCFINLVLLENNPSCSVLWTVGGSTLPTWGASLLGLWSVDLFMVNMRMMIVFFISCLIDFIHLNSNSSCQEFICKETDSAHLLSIGL